MVAIWISHNNVLDEKHWLLYTEESLLRRSQILSLPKPSSQSLDAFTSFFHTKTPFLGPSYELLSSSGSLVSLKLDDEGPDRLSTFIQRYFGYYLAIPDPTRPPSWQPLYYFPARRVARIVACLSIFISALLMMGAILTLYYIPSREMGKRVAAIGAFTTVFAMAVVLLTNARRGEVFGVSAAWVLSFKLPSDYID